MIDDGDYYADVVGEDTHDDDGYDQGGDSDGWF